MGTGATTNTYGSIYGSSGARVGTAVVGTGQPGVTGATPGSSYGGQYSPPAAFNTPNLTHMVELLSSLVRSCTVPQQEEQEASLAAATANSATPSNSTNSTPSSSLGTAPATPSQYPPTLLDPTPIQALSNAELQLLLGRNLFMKIVREYSKVDGAGELLSHLCWESKLYSKHLVDMVREAVVRAPVDSIKPYLRVLTALISLKDTVQSWRIDYALKSHLKGIETMVYSRDACDVCVKYMVKLASRDEGVKVWLYKHKSKLNEVLGEIGYRIVL